MLRAGARLATEKADILTALHQLPIQEQLQEAVDMLPNTTPLAVRFWRHVVKTETCWIWTGHTNKRGYGKITISKGRCVRVNRLSWEMHHGPIPGGMWVLHHCDNPYCVRPDHLFLGTSTDNMRDASNKGRISRGERRYNANIPDAHIAIIRQRAFDGEPQSALAKEYGVSKHCIGGIIHGQSRGWTDGGPIIPARPKRKLTDGDVRKIRVEYAAGGVSMEALSRKYGVCHCSISLIVRYRIYKNVGSV